MDRKSLTSLHCCCHTCEHDLYLCILAESDAVHAKLHSEYTMIKYPRKLLGIPHEKVFKVDKDNLVRSIKFLSIKYLLVC